MRWARNPEATGTTKIITLNAQMSSLKERWSDVASTSVPPPRKSTT